jgi:predicted transcriptional regulator
MAERAETAQSVVARIETGLTDPSTETLGRLLAAAGYRVRCELSPVPVTASHMLDDVYWSARWPRGCRAFPG